MIRNKFYLPLACIVVFSGCSTVSQNEVFGSMERMSVERGAEDLKWIKTAEEAEAAEKSLKTLLSLPLDEENAVRITLINNRALQQVYERIGIAQSELVQAGLMTNPLLGYSFGHGGGIGKTGVTLELAFLDLLWIPLRKELGGLALEETKMDVADEVLRTVRDAKKSYIDVRISDELVRLNGDVLKSYEAALQLAARQNAAGNLSKRDLLKIKDGYARARIESMRLHRDYAVAREALNQRMGLYGEHTDYTLSNEPLKLNVQPPAPDALEKFAMEHRLDIAAARKAVEYAAVEAGYTKNTRLLQEVTLEAQSEKGSGEERFNTFGIKIPIPIFDIGQGRISRTQARYNQSVNHLYELAVNVRSQTREEYAKLRYAYDIAQVYQDSVVKTDQSILEETQLFYNGMLDGIYELLSDQRRYADAKMQSLSALGEYRKSYADLMYVTGGMITAPKDKR